MTVCIMAMSRLIWKGTGGSDRHLAMDEADKKHLYGYLTLPMLRLLSSKARGCKDF